MAEFQAFGRTFNTDNITFLHKIIIGSVIAVAIVGAVGYWVVYPKWEELKVLEAEVEKKEVEKSQKELQVKKLPELKKELEELKARLVLIRRKIPNQSNIAPLLVDLEGVTEKSLFGNEAVLKNFVPGVPGALQLPASLKDAEGSATAKNLQQIPVALDVENTTYPDLIKLLSDYESYERTLSVESISIIPSGDIGEKPYNRVSVSMQVKAFLLQSASSEGAKK